MKNFSQNLLVFLSLALCGLCGWQWYVQTQLHNEGQDLINRNFKLTGDIQVLTNSIRNNDAEIAGLSIRVNELKREAMTNQQSDMQQAREILRLQSAGVVMSNEIVQYKEVVDKLEAQLKEAAAGIEKQNASIKLLVSERDEAIKKYNDSIKERNALAEKYNTLVDRFNKLQTAASGDAPGKQ